MRAITGATDGSTDATPWGLLRSLLSCLLSPQGVPLLGQLNRSGGSRAGSLRIRFLLGGRGPRCHRRALRVLIAATDGPDLIQGEHLTIPRLRIPSLWSATVTQSSQQARGAAAAILSSRLHLYSEVGTLRLALNTSEVRDLTTSTPYLCSEEYILLVGISLWLVLSSLGDSFTKIPMIANSRASSHSRILLSLARTNAVRILFQEERSVVYLLLLIMAKKREK